MGLEGRLSAHALMDDPILSARLHRLPLVTLYLTERCNSRCVTCDYWRHGRADMTCNAVQRLLPSLAQLEPAWCSCRAASPCSTPTGNAIAHALRDAGMKVWLLTSGCPWRSTRGAPQKFSTPSPFPWMAPIGKPTRQFAAWMRSTMSVRAFAPPQPRESRPAFESRCSARTSGNYQALCRSRRISALARFPFSPSMWRIHMPLGARRASRSDLALLPEELPVLDDLLGAMERKCAAEFSSGFIAESPAKLRRILQYFSALHGEASYPLVRCNAPEFSAVVGATGGVQPCFFITGPAEATLRDGGAGAGFDDFSGALNGERMRALRTSIRTGERAECKTCVCSMWRDIAAGCRFGSICA